MPRVPCPTCDTEKFIGSNPNRPNGPWYRCWLCGALWDKDYNDLLVEFPELVLSKDALESGQAGFK